MDFALHTGAQSCWNRKGPSPNCSHKVGAWNCPTSLSMLKHSEFLSLELRGQASSWRTTPHHNPPSTKLYTWHNAVRQEPFSWQLPNPDMSIRLPDGETRRMRLHCSRVQWRRALHHCIQHFALHLLMYSLDAVALRTVLELILRPHEVWRSVATDSAES